MKRFEELSPGERKLIGLELHLCWFPDCRMVWRLEEAVYCGTCDAWRCPRCSRCYCDLPPFAQHVLDAEMASIGLWAPWHNPPTRKRRRTRLEFTEVEFREWLREWYPELAGLPTSEAIKELYKRYPRLTIVIR